MDVKQLRYFLSVVEAGSFSRAAVVLGVTQPVLSRQIRLLEEGLGIDLLFRNGRGVELTEAGRFLKGRAKSILDLVQETQAELGAMRDVPKGNYTIGVPPTVSSVLAVPLVRTVERELPLVSLKVVDALSGHILEWLSNGRLDIAVLYDAPTITTLNVDPLIKEELVLVGPPTNPQNLVGDTVEGQQIGGVPLVLPSHPHGLRVLVERAFEREGLDCHVKYEVDTLATILRFVEDGLGSTILPYASVSRLKRLGRVQTWFVKDPQITRRLVLATSTQRPVTATTRRLVQIVRNQVNELVATGVWVPKGADVHTGETGVSAGEPSAI